MKKRPMETVDAEGGINYVTLRIDPLRIDQVSAAESEALLPGVTRKVSLLVTTLVVPNRLLAEVTWNIEQACVRKLE
jgi:hypothetical protein